jgi:hypothetical protein
MKLWGTFTIRLYCKVVRKYEKDLKTFGDLILAMDPIMTRSRPWLLPHTKLSRNTIPRSYFERTCVIPLDCNSLSASYVTLKPGLDPFRAS